MSRGSHTYYYFQAWFTGHRWRDPHRHWYIWWFWASDPWQSGVGGLVKSTQPCWLYFYHQQRYVHLETPHIDVFLIVILVLLLILLHHRCSPENILGNTHWNVFWPRDLVLWPTNLTSTWPPLVLHAEFQVRMSVHFSCESGNRQTQTTCLKYYTWHVTDMGCKNLKYLIFIGPASKVYFGFMHISHVSKTLPGNRDRSIFWFGFRNLNNVWVVLTNLNVQLCDEKYQKS